MTPAKTIMATTITAAYCVSGAMGLELELLELVELGDSVGVGDEVLSEGMGVDGGSEGAVPDRIGSSVCIRRV